MSVIGGTKQTCQLHEQCPLSRADPTFTISSLAEWRDPVFFENMRSALKTAGFPNDAAMGGAAAWGD